MPLQSTTISEAFAELRRRSGEAEGGPPLSQVRAAKSVGMTPSNWGRIEKNKQHPRDALLRRVARVFRDFTTFDQLQRIREMSPPPGEGGAGWQAAPQAASAPAAKPAAPTSPRSQPPRRRRRRAEQAPSAGTRPAAATPAATAPPTATAAAPPTEAAPPPATRVFTGPILPRGVQVPVSRRETAPATAAPMPTASPPAEHVPTAARLRAERAEAAAASPTPPAPPAAPMPATLPPVASATEARPTVPEPAPEVAPVAVQALPAAVVGVAGSGGEEHVSLVAEHLARINLLARSLPSATTDGAPPLTVPADTRFIAAATLALGEVQRLARARAVESEAAGVLLLNDLWAIAIARAFGDTAGVRLVPLSREERSRVEARLARDVSHADAYRRLVPELCAVLYPRSADVADVDAVRTAVLRALAIIAPR